MAKRVHELAKELNVTSKILLDKLNKLLKIEAKNHMTLLEDDQVDAVLRLFGLKKDTEPVKKEEPKEEVEPQVDSKPEKKSSKKEVDKKAQEIQVKKADKKQVDKQKEKAEVKKEEKAETKKKEKPEEEVKNLNIKLDEADQLLIENFLDNEEATNKVEKIGSKNRQIKSNKVDKSNTSKTNKSVTASQQEQPKKIVIPGSITVKDLAEKLCRPASELIKKLLIIGIIATINKELDYDTASLISMEFGVEVELENIITDEERLINDQPDDISQLQSRPPIVVVMGHVDHGKTSLLDAIKETNVIEKEAGGITQHIGAYSVNVSGRRITFLDTPGHEAFTALRARGAQVTDIAVLVVAADDGIMPQTIEAINHAKAAEVSIIIAINKIDKPDANPERVKQELAQHGLVIEEWGGDTIAVEVSAKKRQNIDQLLEMILLCADMLDLKANPNRLAKGTVIESKLDKGRGPVATVLVQNGTLGIGDTVMAGTTYGRIRAMIDDKGIRTKKAKPSTPVEIQGLSDVPKAGDTFYAVEDERLAKQVVERKRIKEREINIGVTSKVSLDQLFNQIQQGKIKDLNIIIKADVQGSVEALKQSLEKVSNEEVRVRIIHGGVGAINESDVMLASASNAIIIGFNVRPEPSAVVVAERESVDVRLYRIIYNAIEDVESAMKGLLDPQYKEVVIGHVEVRNLFKMSTIGTIAGCYVIDGKILRNCDARLIRDGIVVYEGKLSSLRRFKEDVKEVASGYECGITLEKYNDIKEGDIIEGYIMEEIKR